MARRDDAAITQEETRLDRIDHFGIGNRVDLVQAHNLREATEADFITSTYNVHVTDPHVVSKDQFLYADDHIEMSDLHVVIDVTLSRINDTAANAYPLANAVTKKKPVTWSLQKRWQQRDAGQHGQLEFARSQIDLLDRSKLSAPLRVTPRRACPPAPAMRSAR